MLLGFIYLSSTISPSFEMIFLAKKSIINTVVIFCRNNGCIIQSLCYHWWTIKISPKWDRINMNLTAEPGTRWPAESRVWVVTSLWQFYGFLWLTMAAGDKRTQMTKMRRISFYGNYHKINQWNIIMYNAFPVYASLSS